MPSFILTTLLLSSTVFVLSTPLPQFGNTNSGNGADNTGNSIDDPNNGYESPPFWIWVPPPVSVAHQGANLASGGPSIGNDNIGSGPNSAITNPPFEQAGADNSVDNTANNAGNSNNGGECLSSREPQFGNGINGLVNCGNGGNNSGNGNGGSNNGDENGSGPAIDQTGADNVPGSSDNSSAGIDTENPPIELSDANNGVESGNINSGTSTENPPNGTEENPPSTDDTGSSTSNSGSGCLFSREPQFGNGVNGVTDCGNGGDNSGNGSAGSNSGNENTSVGPPEDSDIAEETDMN
ncbi:hypothetical protein CVT25_010516 [Psilocybe cyanescens]|uniref:Uncharacterized protein n=1 Tax=Psilocybe cyanescens TaxID=93625 RepID=A0A409XP60_PSICY|nr:hypothetical protein CVT25_010516 [Psilocybe cyanescens]